MNSGLITSTSSRNVAKKMKKRAASAVKMLEDFNRKNTQEHGVKIINSAEFRSIMVATVLFPFIGKSTPMVQISELKKAQEQERGRKINKAQVAYMLGIPMRELEIRDFYALLMTESLNGAYNYSN